MIRTTVMLPDETHVRLRRLARRRGLPLAALIRAALTDAVESEPQPTLSFIGVVDVDPSNFSAASTATMPLPITPPVSEATPDELEELRRRADELASLRADGC